MTACSIFPDGTVNSAEETIAVTVDGSGQLKGNLNDAIEVDADNSKTGLNEKVNSTVKLNSIVETKF